MSRLNRNERNYRKDGSSASYSGGGKGGGKVRGAFFNPDESGENAADAERATKAEIALTRQELDDNMDSKFGYERHRDGETRLGWLINMKPGVTALDRSRVARSSIDFYFMQEDGGRFKATLVYQPYFYISVKEGTEIEVEQYLRRKYEGVLVDVEHCPREDLDLKNHLIGIRQLYLKLKFINVSDLLRVRKPILTAVRKNAARAKESTASTTHTAMFTAGGASASTDFTATRATTGPTKGDVLDSITDIREYDVPYHIRVAIDNQINVGLWYDVRSTGTDTFITHRPDLLERPDPVVFAFDIETTKLPLKFPDAKIDSIMMISYMIDRQGYLITNREVISADVDDFEYTPKPEYEGPFIVFNEPNERALLERFFEHIVQTRPSIFVTFNGDFFDWPFVEQRAEMHGISMADEIGFAKDNQNEYKARHASHMDAYRWVKRDSYLPQGSQGLKAVTKAKLGYNPLEIDPEEMCRMASEQPQVMSNYSVSDAVATYYLYMKYVHPFIFALCTIIPMEPDEVLRKGSGTLCETLLMVESFKAEIVMPNKQEQKHGSMYKGHLLDVETYVGGHVEALESGVFRSDLKYQFRLVPQAFQDLIDRVEPTLRHEIRHEANVDPDLVTNFNEVRDSIVETLEQLRDTPFRLEEPLIYHLDVSAMYPNIILTNRLQPSSVVDEATCAACDFNRPESQCQRKLQWSWRGEYLPARRNEYEMIKMQLESERVPGASPGLPSRMFQELSLEDQSTLLKKRLGDYCRKVYKKTRETKVEERESTVCMRENPFYVDTVRAFRDRRYEFKALLKTWKRKVDACESMVERQKALNMVVLYDSLQLAHKCILNSFYGYVMRRGARWYSMEMAGIVCHTGANIIKEARILVEQIGRALELDTDGIWCMLPGSFPENYEMHTSDGKKKKFVLSYPGAMLNLMVNEKHTNHQYQDLDPTDPQKLRYSIKSENSIFFEVDGPYRAMILPASKEEDKRLKKRYAVFNEDGSLAELKGFEIKRRGELKIVKIFQSEVFESFLKGDTLEECYTKVADVANYWLDVLYSQARDLADEELFELISENRSMSRTLEDYGEQKSTSISTAKRLAEFLGDQMVKDKGLACQFVISRKPEGAPVTERTIPTAIFRAEPAVRRHYLLRWLKLTGGDAVPDIRDLLDWGYYIERFASCVQKIVTIPAAMQRVGNPVPRVRHPDWLLRRLAEKLDTFKQKRMDEFLVRKPALGGLVNASRAGDEQEVDGEEEDMVDDEPGEAALDGDCDVEMEEVEVEVEVEEEVEVTDDEANDSDDDLMQPAGEAADAVDGGAALEAAPKKTKIVRRTVKRLVKKMVKKRRPVDVGDMEDFGTTVRRPNVPVVTRCRKRPATTSSASETAPVEPTPVKSWRDMGKAPDEKSDYQGWLRHQKEKWRLQREERKRRRDLMAKAAEMGVDPATLGVADINPAAKGTLVGMLDTSGRGGKKSRLATGVPMQLTSFFQRQTRALVRHTWQLLQIAATPTPGEFRLWLMANGMLHAVDLHVPREFYVNSRTLDPELTWPRVNRILPRSHPCFNLYKFSMPEKQYLEKSRELSAFLMHTDIEGVYETKVPLVFRALLRLGSVCGVRRSSPHWSNPGQGVPYCLDDLQMVENHAYVADGALRTALLYHSAADTRGVMGFFHAKTSVVINVDPYRTDRMPNVRRTHAALWRQHQAMLVKARAEAGEPEPSQVTPDVPETMSFTVHTVRDFRGAFRLVQSLLVDLQNEHKGPTMLVYQSPLSELELSEHMPTLREFPTARMQSNASDNLYPPLDWQRFAVTRLLTGHLNYRDWFREQLRHARYAQVPVGNIEADFQTFAADLAYGRALLQRGHVLWVSPSVLPDLGGKEDDDNRLMMETEGIGATGGVEINAPGNYATVCVEVTLTSLAVNTVLQSNHIHDMEGAAGSLATFDSVAPRSLGEHLSGGVAGLMGANMSAFDEAALCSGAFRVLKSLVHTWLHQVIADNNEEADQQLMNFYRWLKTSSALLHDPGLCRLLFGMMKKLFMQLIGEFRRLGATIVFANFNKIVLSTRKTTLADAEAYMKYIFESIRQRDLFSTISFEASHYWMELLWMDQANYGAIPAVHAERVTTPGNKSPFRTPGSGRGGGQGAMEVSNDGEEEAGRGRTEEGRARRKLMMEEPSEASELRLPDEFSSDEDEEEDEESAEEKAEKKAEAQRRKRARRRVLDEDEDEEEEDDDDDEGEREEGEGSKDGDGDVEMTRGASQARSVGGGDEDVTVEAAWNICEFLPDALQDYFLVLVAEYMTEVYKQRVATREQQSTLSQSVVLAKVKQQRLKGNGKDAPVVLSEEEALFVKELVHKKLFERMAHLMGLIQKMLPGDGAPLAEGLSSDAFPRRAGSHLRMRSPALEFCKFVCHVLSLNSEVASEVAIMKRSLLRLVQVREFSESAVFHNPCLSYTLTDVICKHCKHCRDLDLCRDEDLMADDLSQRFKCPSCSFDYDRAEIEQQLVETIQRYVVSYQLQDCVCNKCHEVRADNLSTYCKCSGSFSLAAYSQKALHDKLRTFHSIAKFHVFELLEDTCSRLMQLSDQVVV